ncbi:MAG: hypothetical protein M1831_006323 [Alyxoria varia]|nr:MAG: hypothetical protein M1831_006323 [Alyxoria varia]
MPGEATIISSQWREVELGRVVLFNRGEFSGKLATIVEIVDHKRALVDNPIPTSSENPDSSPSAVPRHSAPLSHVTLTHLKIPNVPRGVGIGPLRKRWTENKIDEKWAESSQAKKRAQSDRRRQLSDFERFKVMRLRKMQRAEERKVEAKLRKEAKSAA